MYFYVIVDFTVGFITLIYGYWNRLDMKQKTYKYNVVSIKHPKMCCNLGLSGADFS